MKPPHPPPCISLGVANRAQSNLKGLRHMAFKGLRPQAPVSPLGTTRAYRVVHSPYVYYRAGPSQDGAVLGVAPHGTRIEVDGESAGWLRTAAVVADGQKGWVLLDGSKAGLGTLLEPCA